MYSNESESVLTVERDVTLKQVGCTHSTYNSFSESSTINYFYYIGGIMVPSCRNLGCLDDQADNYNENAEHADLDSCIYNLSSNKTDPNKCNYDSTATADGPSSTSKWGKYQFYCSDKESGLCQNFLNYEIENPILKDQAEITSYQLVNALSTNPTIEQVNASMAAGVKFNITLQDDLIQALGYNSSTMADSLSEFLAANNLVETAALEELAELYIQITKLQKKKQILTDTIESSADVSSNVVADPLDHKKAVQHRLQDDLTQPTELIAEKTELYNLKLGVLNARVDITYPPDLIISYVALKATREKDSESLRLSCGGNDYKLKILNIDTNTTDEIDINRDNIMVDESGNISILKTGFSYGTHKAGIHQHTSISSRSNDNEFDFDLEFTFGTKACDDTTAINYDASLFDQIQYINGREMCEYQYCADEGAANYTDGTEFIVGIPVANRDACAFYYCEDVNACNYESVVTSESMLYNNDGLIQTGVNLDLAVATKSTPMCFIPNIEIDQMKIDNGQYYKEENIANKLYGGEQFTSNLLSTHITETTLMELGSYSLTIEGTPFNFGFNTDGTVNVIIPLIILE
jgi:hypothetical protein